MAKAFRSRRLLLTGGALLLAAGLLLGFVAPILDLDNVILPMVLCMAWSGVLFLAIGSGLRYVAFLALAVNAPCLLFFVLVAFSNCYQWNQACERLREAQESLEAEIRWIEERPTHPEKFSDPGEQEAARARVPAAIAQAREESAVYIARQRKKAEGSWEAFVTTSAMSILLVALALFGAKVYGRMRRPEPESPASVF